MYITISNIISLYIYIQITLLYILCCVLSKVVNKLCVCVCVCV